MKEGYYLIKNKANMKNFIIVCGLKAEDYNEEIEKQTEKWGEEYIFIWTGASVVWYDKDKLNIPEEQLLNFDNSTKLRGEKLKKIL
jgi:hypothetical protein